MPNRIIREGILSSDRIDQLDAPAEVFYRRLMSRVDDHGLFDARTSMLRASLYPLRVDRVREADIARWIAACEKAGVIALYTHESKPFGQMLDTRWQARSEPKYPLPPWGYKAPQALANTCAQLQTTAPLVVVGDVVENVDGNARKRAPASRSKALKTEMPADFAVSAKVKAWALERGFDRTDEHLQAFARKCAANGYRYADWDAALMEAIREDWAKLRGGKPGGVAPPAESATSRALQRATADETARQDAHARKLADPEEQARIAEMREKARKAIKVVA